MTNTSTQIQGRLRSLPAVLLASPDIRRNSLGAGRHAFALRFARLRLLQRRALRPLAHGELHHLSAASAVADGELGVQAGLGAGAPLGPVGHLAVFGEDAGLDGLRQLPRCAQAEEEERGRGAEV